MIGTLALAGGSGAPTTGTQTGAAAQNGPTLVPGELVHLSRTRPPNHKNISYATTSPKQKLDLYLPSGNGPFPTVIFVHGGAFRFGDQDSVDPTVGQALLDAGYAIVSVDYRLSGDATFPAAVQDVKAAVRWTRANAAKYQLDPNRFVAFGESAGGNLAALIGTTANAKTVFDAPNLGNAGVSSAVKAVVDFFGPNDFSQIDSFLRAGGCPAAGINHNTAQGFESLYLGAALPTVPAKVKQANPVTYVDAKDPVFLIQNGTKDCLVGGGQGKLLADALDRVGVTFSRDLFQGAGHGGPEFFYNTVNAQRVVAFLDRYVK